MDGYKRSFDDDKSMSFFIPVKELMLKYNERWSKILSKYKKNDGDAVFNNKKRLKT